MNKSLPSKSSLASKLSAIAGSPVTVHRTSYDPSDFVPKLDVHYRGRTFVVSCEAIRDSFVLGDDEFDAFCQGVIDEFNLSFS